MWQPTQERMTRRASCGGWSFFCKSRRVQVLAGAGNHSRECMQVGIAVARAEAINGQHRRRGRAPHCEALRRRTLGCANGRRGRPTFPAVRASIARRSFPPSPTASTDSRGAGCFGNDGSSADSSKTGEFGRQFAAQKRAGRFEDLLQLTTTRTMREVRVECRRLGECRIGQGIENVVTVHGYSPCPREVAGTIWPARCGREVSRLPG